MPDYPDPDTGIEALERAFREEHGAALAEAHPPTAAVVWWRAQRRARAEAARRAARPISFVHGIALGCAIGACAALLALGSGAAREALAVVARVTTWHSLFTLFTAGAPATIAGIPLGVVVAVAATLLLAPVVICLALEER